MVITGLILGKDGFLAVVSPFVMTTFMEVCIYLPASCDLGLIHRVTSTVPIDFNFDCEVPSLDALIASKPTGRCSHQFSVGVPVFLTCNKGIIHRSAR